MTSLESFYGRLVPQFKESGSWMGPYSEARRENRFRHLTDQCLICFENFLPEDQLVVLPCSHGMHERCFAPWPRQTCPLEGTPVSTTKVSLLGRTLSFPPRARNLGIWLSDRKEEFGAFLIQLIRMLPNELLEDLLNHEEIASFGDRAATILQDLLNAYDGNLSLEEIPERARDHISNLFPFFRSFGLERSIRFFGEDTDLKLAAHYLERNLSSVVSALLLAVSANQRISFTVSYQGMERVLVFLFQILRETIQQPYFLVLSKELDRRFHLKHFRAIRQLGSDWERYSYLWKLKSKDLQRLRDLTQGAGGPTSQLIQYAHLHDKRCRNFFSKVKAQIPFLACCGVMLWAYFHLRDEE